MGKSEDPLWEAEIAIRSDNSALAVDMRSLLQRFTSHAIDVVAHRVVRSVSPLTVDAELITASVVAAITEAVELAPDHNPITLDAIDASRELLPSAQQVAVYDSAYHRTIPAYAALYAGPYEWFTEGFRKIGFHGLSHAYCARRATQLLRESVTTPKVVIAHLGSGASLAAVHGERSVDTTMGFTPLDGLMMATRSGSIDPGLLLYLLRKNHYSVDQLEHVLNKGSGLRGVSGLETGDMRDVIEAADRGDERAALAFATFIYRLRCTIGAMVGALEGVDALVFTGGIGENSARVRSEACQGLRYLGIAIDRRRNAAVAGDTDISSSGARVQTFVIHTREEWELARLAYSVLT
jgi:acetate kinase